LRLFTVCCRSCVIGDKGEEVRRHDCSLVLSLSQRFTIRVNQRLLTHFLRIKLTCPANHAAELAVAEAALLDYPAVLTDLFVKRK